MARKYRYDYYTIDVPREAFESPDMSEEETDERQADCAINEAREKARLYVIPCEWRIISQVGDTVRVCRVRRA